MKSKSKIEKRLKELKVQLKKLKTEEETGRPNYTPEEQQINAKIEIIEWILT